MHIAAPTPSDEHTKPLVSVYRTNLRACSARRRRQVLECDHLQVLQCAAHVARRMWTPEDVFRCPHARAACTAHFAALTLRVA